MNEETEFRPYKAFGYNVGKQERAWAYAQNKQKGKIA
jgi:hypothetical protein